MLAVTSSPSRLRRQLRTGFRDPWSKAMPFDFSEFLQIKILSPITKKNYVCKIPAHFHKILAKKNLIGLLYFKEIIEDSDVMIIELLLMFFCVSFFFILTRGHAYWLWRGGKRGRERGKETLMWEKHWLVPSQAHRRGNQSMFLSGCHSRTYPTQGLNSQPRNVPWPGKPVTFWFTGWYSNQLSHTSQDSNVFIFYILNWRKSEYVCHTKICHFLTSGQDGGIGRCTLPPCTSKRRKTTNLKTKNNQNCQKIELCGTPTSKELKKKYSPRLVGEAETSSQGREEPWQGTAGGPGGWDGSWWSHICMQVNQEEQLQSEIDCTTQSLSQGN